MALTGLNVADTHADGHWPARLTRSLHSLNASYRVMCTYRASNCEDNVSCEQNASVSPFPYAPSTPSNSSSRIYNECIWDAHEAAARTISLRNVVREQRHYFAIIIPHDDSQVAQKD